MGRLLTVAEAAALLGTSERFPRRLIAEQRIQVVRVGRFVRIPAGAIDALISDGRSEPTRTTALPAAPVRMAVHGTRRSQLGEVQGVARRRRFGYLRALPSGRFQASYVGPDKMRRNAPHTFATRTRAVDWLVDIEATILNETWRDPEAGRELLSTYAARWIAERDLRVRTKDQYEWQLGRHILPTLGRLRINQITPARVRTWFAAFPDLGFSDDARAKAYRLLRAILNTAAADGTIQRNPCQIKGGGQHKTPERPVISMAQAQFLERNFPPKLQAMIPTALYGSLRFGEVAGLRRHVIEPEASEIRIREQITQRIRGGELVTGPPKSEAGKRAIRMPADGMQKLLMHMDVYVDNEPDALLFTNMSGGALRRSVFNKLVHWDELVAAIGVPHLYFNDLRHTGNTIAAGTPGVSTRDLMERMGHSTMRAAIIYQHATAEAAQRIADAFDDRATQLKVVRSACDNEGSTGVSSGQSIDTESLQKGRSEAVG